MMTSTSASAVAKSALLPYVLEVVPASGVTEKGSMLASVQYVFL